MARELLSVRPVVALHTFRLYRGSLYLSLPDLNQGIVQGLLAILHQAAQGTLPYDFAGATDQDILPVPAS